MGLDRTSPAPDYSVDLSTLASVPVKYVEFLEIVRVKEFQTQDKSNLWLQITHES